MSRIVYLLTLSLLLFLFGTKGSNAALLDGKLVGYQYLFDTQSSVYYQPPDFVVGPGIEVPYIHGDTYAAISVDVSDTNLLIESSVDLFFNTGDFNGIRIYDAANSIPAFTSVTVNPATNLLGFSAANVSFDADNIYVNLQALNVSPSGIISLDIEGIVPEPATFVTATMMVCMVGLLVRIRQ